MFTAGMLCVSPLSFLRNALLTYAPTAFDRPSSANAWQYYIQHFLNSKYPWVMFYLTTFVICAMDQEDAENKTETLLNEMEDRGWRVTLPRTHEWTGEVEELKLDTLYEGVRPA
jgi:hypothetical protein